MADKTHIEQAIERFLDHAVERHVHGTANGYNEFAELGVENAGQLRDLIHRTLNDPETMGAITSKDGSHIVLYHEKTNVFIAMEPKSGGSVFRPPDGIDKFNYEALRHKTDLGENFLEVRSGGLPALQEAFAEKFGHVAKIGPLARLGQAFDIAIDIAPRVIGRTFKYVPLAGTAATFALGRAEAAELREQAQQAVNNGALPAAAMGDYELVLTAHQIQVNADILIVSQEPQVQRLFDVFADKYDLPDDLRETLEPPSLFEDITGIELRDPPAPGAGPDLTPVP